MGKRGKDIMEANTHTQMGSRKRIMVLKDASDFFFFF